MENRLGALVVASFLTYCIIYYLPNYTVDTYFHLITLRLLTWEWWQIWLGCSAFCLFYEQLFTILHKVIQVILTGFSELFVAFTMFLTNVKSKMWFLNKKKKGIHGNATFMSWWLQWRHYFNKNNTGWTIGNKSMPDGNSVGKDLTLGGVIALGGMGTGKTASIAIPSLIRFALHGEKNIFVCDPSGKTYNHTSEMMARLGYKVYRFSTVKETVNQSLRFNPLSWCESVSDCAILAEKIMSFQLGNSTNSTSQFFMNRAKTFLTAILVTICKQEPQYRNLPNAFRLLLHYSGDPETFTKAIELALDGEENLRLQWVGLNSESSNKKELGSVISSAENALKFAGDPTMAFLLSGDEFDLDALRNEKMVFYNQFKETDEYFTPVNALLLSYCFDKCLSGQEASEGKYRGMRFILDELFCLPPINTFPKIVANGRKYDTSVLAIFQGLDQLHTKFQQDAHAILDGIQTQVLFKGLKPKYYEELQRVMGTKTVEDDKGFQHKQQLISVQEMEQMEELEAIIKMPALPAIKTTAPLYYKPNSIYYKWSKFGALPSPTRDITDVPYLDFSHNIENDIIDGFSEQDSTAA